MSARVLVLALPLLLAGEEPPRDPFLAALAGRSGPEAVAAPGFDAEAEALSWSLRPRREIVDGLAARLLRGETGPWPAAGERSATPVPWSPIPRDFAPDGVPVTDRLAAWVPADAAAVFFPSLREAEDLVASMEPFLSRAFPVLCGDPPGGRRDALRRAAERLLLPTIWAANPGVRTGTRQVAIVAADPDLRWGADVALVAEVDDASLVAFHRRASLRWEGRKGRTLRVEGLDAVSDDGSVRSFFGMEGGVAVWATTRDLRDRILAAGAGRGDSLLRPDRRAWAFARRTFPAEEGGALLVVPQGFLARICEPRFRARRAAALRCEAVRLLLDARSLAGQTVSRKDTFVLACPAGGSLAPVSGEAGSSCSLHGTASDPVPLGDLPECGPPAGDLDRDWFRRSTSFLWGLPRAARWSEGRMEAWIPSDYPWSCRIMDLAGDAWAAVREGWAGPEKGDLAERRILERAGALAAAGLDAASVEEALARLDGTSSRERPGEPGKRVPLEVGLAPDPGRGGILGIRIDEGRVSGGLQVSPAFVRFEWR
ncbi:MAG: hypothetical protein L6R43_15415 [Planctomycetes bacterium]|nr:hypothetical protein [Planctomycetota bacterium]